MRCPACGAANTDRAAWCTQCYGDLRAEPGHHDRREEPADPSPVAAEEPGTAPVGEARDVRTVDGEVEWRCASCDRWNRLDAPRCATCSAPRQGFGDTLAPPPVAPGDRPRLFVATLVLPGLGHLLVRRTGSGVARLLLAVGWLGGGIAVLRASGAGGLPAAPLLLGAAVVWAGSLHDVLALADDGRELLTSRTLLWLTGAVALALVLAGAVTVGTTTR